MLSTRKNRLLIFLLGLNPTGFHPFFALPHSVEEGNAPIHFSSISSCRNLFSIPDWVNTEEEGPRTNVFGDANWSNAHVSFAFTNWPHSQTEQGLLENFIEQHPNGTVEECFASLFSGMSLGSDTRVAHGAAHPDPQMDVCPSAQEVPRLDNEVVVPQPAASSSPTGDAVCDLSQLQEQLTAFTRQNPKGTAREFLVSCDSFILPNPDQSKQGWEAEAHLEDEQGARANCGLASLYSEGKGVAQDWVRAKAYLEKASAFSGSGEVAAEAKYNLGVLCYKGGQGIEKDVPRAITLWKESAAIGGECGAHASLGLAGWLLNDKTACIASATESAHAYLLQSAQFAGEVGAQANDILGYLYWCGKGTRRDPECAAKHWKLAAEFGGEIGARANYALGNLYSEGTGIRRDAECAAKYWKLAAQFPGRMGEKANCALGRLYCVHFKDYTLAEDCWKQVVDSQEASIRAEANCYLGTLYADIFKNDELAEAHLKKAVDIQEKKLRAQVHFHLGTLYHNFRKQDDLAEQHWENARKTGGSYGALASLALGLLYLERDDVEDHVERVAGYLSESAAFEGQESAPANCELACLYLQGDKGFKKDLVVAVKYLKKASKFQSGMGAYANYALGQLYQEGGPGIAPDPKSAEQHLKAALNFDEKLDPDVKHRLGTLYYCSLNDTTLAEKYWKEAADSQDDAIKAKANRSLGLLYHEILKNNILAEQCWNKAAAGQDEAIKADANYQLGLLYWQDLEKPRLAVPFLKKAADAHPNKTIQAKANDILGQLYYNLFQDYRLAAEHWEKVIDAQAAEMSVEASYNLGVLYHQKLERPDLAERFWKKAADAQGKDTRAEANYALGVLYHNQKKYDLAKKHWKAASECQGEVGAAASYELGLLHVVNPDVVQDLPTALSYLEEAAKSSEKMGFSAKLMLGQLYAARKEGPGDRERAMQNFQAVAGCEGELGAQAKSLLEALVVDPSVG